MIDAKGFDVVLKLSGKVVDDDAALAALARGVAALVAGGTAPLVIHGGGRQIDALADRLGVSQTVVEGRRVTSQATLEAVSMGLLGSVQPRLLGALRAAGVRGLGLSGLSGAVVTATRRPPMQLGGREVDLGLVGDVAAVDTGLLAALRAQGVVPVLASLAGTAEGGLLNVNADTLAAAVAVRTGARLLLIASDTEGLYRDRADPTSRVERLLADAIPDDGGWGGASAGMRPKLAAAAHAVHQGVAEVRLVGPAALADLEGETRGAQSRGTIIAKELA
jgi:acetylglutamate kinase